MSLPSPPIRQPQDMKDAQNKAMTQSFLTNMKEAYGKRQQYDQAKKDGTYVEPKKPSLLNPAVLNPDTAFQIWQYPREF